MRLFRKMFDQYKVSCTMQVFLVLIIPQVYLVPGSEFGCQAPGWFRIIFTVGETRLVEGLGRLTRALQHNNSQDNMQRSDFAFLPSPRRVPVFAWGLNTVRITI